LVVAVLVIGPRRLPETAAAIGKAVRDIRAALGDEVAARAPCPAASAAEGLRAAGGSRLIRAV